MDQLRRLFEKLTWAQRIWLAVAVTAVIGGLSALSHWNQERDFKPLFGNLAAEDAGALVAKLKETGIAYRLADGGATVLVPSASVAEARLSMAAAGLPKSGRIGFELFDKTNFGASDFAEQVNYHRAVEGELERSVMSIQEVEQARVHITWAKDSLYSESRQPAKASVLVRLRPGSHLSGQNIAAICQLTASAAPELNLDQVSLVDTNGTLLNRPRTINAGEEASEAALEYRKRVERDLQTKIAATLDPLLGADHFRAGVSVDLDLTSGEQSDEIFDPTKSALVTSSRTEDGPALPLDSGVPGTASNLPRPTSIPVTGSANYARKTENSSFQTSRTVKHTKLPQGEIKKISLSVLVDHSLRWEGVKKIVEPPSAEKLRVIQNLVAAATGLNTERGDQLMVQAFPFEATLIAEPLSKDSKGPSPNSIPLPPWLEKLIGKQSPAVIAGVAGGAFAAIIGVLVGLLLRGAKKKKIASEQAAQAIQGAQTEGALEPVLSPEEMRKQIEAKMAEQSALAAKREAEELMKLKFPAIATKKTEVLTKHIVEEAKKNPAMMAQVVRTWLNNGSR